MNRLGVVGWPVAHSLSPALHNAALDAAGLAGEWHYQLLPVPPGLFDETVRALPGDGFRGVNVTIPHKRRALELARRSGGAVSARALAIGAANTLLFRADGRIDADNTDAPALAKALARRDALRGARALVLGAGGSARAAVWALRDGGAAQVRVWSRSAGGARELCDELGGTAVQEVPEDLGEVLINCTSVGLSAADTLEMLPLTQEALRRLATVVDLVYRPGGTPLVNHAAGLGIQTIDGLELLVGQGAIAFGQFTGVAASVRAMRRAVGLSSAP